MQTWQLLLAGVVFLAGCQQKNEFVAPPPPMVTVALPVKQEVQEYYETTGQTRAAKVVELRARVSGYLKSIEFQDGDEVEQDQLLYEIDPDIYQAAVASAQAALEKATAQYNLAEQNLKRTTQLINQQVVTESELEIQQAELASTKADVASAKAALRDAELNLGYTKITAPFAGRIGHHMVDVGNLVQTGETALARIETVDPIHAYFTISESDLLRFLQMIRAGQIQPVDETHPLTVEMALGDSEDFAFQGKLDFREFGVDPATGTTQRRALFENQNGELIPGLFVRVRAAIGQPAEKLMVAEQALAYDQQGAYLMTVDEKNIVHQRHVQTGILVNGLRVIESGIEPTEQVIVTGLQRARPDGEVNIGKGPVEMQSFTTAGQKPVETSPGNGESEKMESGSQPLEATVED